MQTVVLSGVYFPFVDFLSSAATAIVLGYGGWRHVYDVGVLAGPPLEAAAQLRGAAAVPVAAR